MRMILLAVLTLSACRGVVPLDRETAWVSAVEASSEEQDLRAARAAWAFLEQTDPEDPRHERARRLLARSLEGLGLRQAAGLLYRDLALLRRDPRVASEALTGVRRIVEGGAHDPDLLVEGLVASGGLAGVPETHRAFVAWHQARDLSRRQLDDWSAAVRAEIPEDDPLAHRVRWLEAIEALGEGRFEDAAASLDALREAEDLPADLQPQVVRARARLAFETGEHATALDLYDTLGDEASVDAALVLERAWTHYHLGDARSTLGQLLALDAPAHQGALFPERYVLEALALRRLCQFAGARRVTTRLRRDLGPVLDDLRAGVPAAEVPRLRSAARLRPGLRELAAVDDALARERAEVGTLGLQKPFQVWLDDLYARARADVARRLEPRLDARAEAIGEELLLAEEGVDLVAHELGVALLRGRRRPHGPEEVAAPPPPLAGEVVVFQHRGEFWNDELDDLRVVAEDRCVP